MTASWLSPYAANLDVQGTDFTPGGDVDVYVYVTGGSSTHTTTRASKPFYLPYCTTIGGPCTYVLTDPGGKIHVSVPVCVYYSGTVVAYDRASGASSNKFDILTGNCPP